MAQSAIMEVAAMVGENIKLRRGFMLSTSSHGVVCFYLHTCPQPGSLVNFLLIFRNIVDIVSYSRVLASVDLDLI